MYLVKFSKQAMKDKQLLKAAGLERKARELLAILQQDPFHIPPPYEPLVGNLQGLYSRRISLKHRLVYSVRAQAYTEADVTYEGVVKVDRMWTHYENIG